MTFEEFQATRRRAENAEAMESLIGGNTGFDEGVSGYVYHGGLHIFDLDKGGFELVIGNVIDIAETSEGLEALERKLYEWGKDEGVID
jgi:hypothetical protein